MRTLRLALATLVGLAVAADAVAHEPLQPLTPTIVAYRWRLLVPHWVVEPRAVQAPASLEWDAGRVPYALPDFEFVSRRIGVLPHFECKYSDFGLPNACTTTWRAVDVEVPVVVVERGSIDVDVPRWKRPGDAIVVDVARLEWKEATLDVSLPALARCATPGSDQPCAR